MPWTEGTAKNGDTESVIALAFVAAKESSDARPSKDTMRSMDRQEPWDTRISTEQARVGMGRAVVITAGHGVRTVPPKKK